MNPDDTPTPGHAEGPQWVDTPFDKALRSHFQWDAEPDDNGFSQRVMAALPAQTAQTAPGGARWDHWALQAHWVAISLAAVAVAALALVTEGRTEGVAGVALYTLVGLLSFWALPSRWSRG